MDMERTQPNLELLEKEAERDTEAALVNNTIDIDYDKLNSIAIEHLLIHAEETALAAAGVQQSVCNKWHVKERSMLLDEIRNKKYDDAIRSLHELIPACESTGAVLSLLCAKAWELARTDYDAALEMVATDITRAALNNDTHPEAIEKTLSSIMFGTELVDTASLVESVNSCVLYALNLPTRSVLECVVETHNLINNLTSTANTTVPPSLNGLLGAALIE